MEIVFFGSIASNSLVVFFAVISGIPAEFLLQL